MFAYGERDVKIKTKALGELPDGHFFLAVSEDDVLSSDIFEVVDKSGEPVKIVVKSRKTLKEHVLISSYPVFHLLDSEYLWKGLPMSP